MPVEEQKGPEVDVLADTFAKFGLNMGALLSGAAVESTESELGSQRQLNCRVQALLQLVPDYGFLTDSKLFMDELFP